MGFSHLHVHSTYSLLDGLASIEGLILRAKELGQDSIAITDHGSTSGLYDAQELGKKHGIKVILGTEFYIERENDGKNGHIVVLAKNDVGLSNIFKLQKFAYTENFYRKPRINFEELVKHKEGLIVMSACLASTFCQHLMNDEINEARGWARMYKESLGDNFYLEIQPNSIPEQWEVNRHTISIGKELGIKVVATNDVHYILKEDNYAHEVLLAIQTGKKMNDEKRFKFDTQDFWLKSKKEMVETFYSLKEDEILSALDVTKEIADRCNAKFVEGKFLPQYYDIPDGLTSRELLIKEVTKGAKEKNLLSDVDYMKDVQHEINVIDEEGYSDYFLIVQDYIRSARERGEVVGDGRGSGAGSKVVYLTDITRIEPRQYDLLFERFMAHNRTPDIDTDFSNQEAVFKDLQNKYGKDSVAKIVTFGRMTPKAVCRKVFSTFGHSTSISNIISKMIPDLCQSMNDAYRSSPDLLKYKEKYKVEFDIIEKLEGMISHEGQHAGGIVIYPDIYKYLPVKTLGEDRSKLIVAVDMNTIEDLHFYKFDVLGLETIGIIKTCLDIIEEDTGVKPDLYDIDYDDENIYKMLSSGDVSGVFQLSNQASKIMEQMPKNFKDLIAINALIRPGIGDWEEYIDRRNGKEWSVHPDREYYMEDTFGTLTYQEQFLLDAKTFAGWDIAYADKHIRKNRNIKEDVELKRKFVLDSSDRGYLISDIEPIWTEIENSVGQYSFNKSHSAVYAMTSFQTAYLKYYYPKHFYASMMSYEDTTAIGQASISGYIAECKQRGISILPPDLNSSTEDFAIDEEGIRYKLSAITHVGDSAIKGINKIRPILSLQDMLERREKKLIRKNVIENLIKAGCFDFENTNRAELLWQFDTSERTKTQIKEDIQLKKYAWNDKVKCMWEKQSLGLYLSVHPMEKYGFKRLETFDNNRPALQGGEITEVAEIYDKNGNKMAFVMLDTLFGVVKVVVFSSMWNEETKVIMQVNNIVLIKGNRSGDSILFNSGEILE